MKSFLLSADCSLRIGELLGDELPDCSSDYFYLSCSRVELDLENTLFELSFVSVLLRTCSENLSCYCSLEIRTI